MNIKFNFITIDGNAVNSPFSLQPINYPLINGEYTVTGDVITSSFSPSTINLIPNTYKIGCNVSSSNDWFISSSANTYVLLGGSTISSSRCNVYFDVQNSTYISGAVSMSISPLNKNTIYVYNNTSSFVLGDTLNYITNNNGYLACSLISQPYVVSFKGNTQNTSFTFYPTGSGNANKVMIQNNNVSNIIIPSNSALYSYTAQASDAKYIAVLGSSASYANTASYAATASYITNASGVVTINGSEQQGIQTTATGYGSHAEGGVTTAYGQGSHAEGYYTKAYGQGSHAEGYYTIASGSYQHVSGKYNTKNNTSSLFVVGNGIGDNVRSDILLVNQDNVIVSGSLSVTNGITGSLIVTNGITSQTASVSSLTTNNCDLSIIPGVSTGYYGNNITMSGGVGYYGGNVAIRAGGGERNGNIYLQDGYGTTQLTVNTIGVTGNLIGSSSYAATASYATTSSAATSITFTPASASFATTASYYNGTVTTATSASYLSGSIYNYQLYTTLTTSSALWITCSLTTPKQYVSITTGQIYNFTQSDMPTTGQVAMTTLYINNTAAATSSLSFPSSWKWLGSVPTAITASKIAMLSLEAYDTSTILASYAPQY